MDNTIERVKLKNDELKRELRSLIAQDSPMKNTTLSPLDMNKSYQNTKEINGDKDQNHSLHSNNMKENVVSSNQNTKNTPKLRSNFNTLKPESTPINESDQFKGPRNREPTTIRSPLMDRTFRPKIPDPSINTLRETPGDTPVTRAKEDNLLITKILSQDQQISELKQIIVQLKRDNSQLQQQVYQQPILIDQMRQRNETQIKEITNKFHQQLQDSSSVNTQLMAKITALSADNHHLQQDYTDIVTQLHQLQQHYNLLLKDEDINIATQEDHYEQIKNYQTYLRVNNRLIQNNIINKFVDKCDQIGLLIDNDLNVNQVSNYEDNEDDTGKLLGDNNTTNKILLQKHYPTLSQLMVKNTIKVDRWRVVRIFLIALRRLTKE